MPMLFIEFEIPFTTNHYWVVTPDSNQKSFRLHQIIGAQTLKEVVSALNHDTGFTHKCETNNFKFYNTSKEAREAAEYASKKICKDRPGLCLAPGVLHAEIGKDSWEIKAIVNADIAFRAIEDE